MRYSGMASLHGPAATIGAVALAPVERTIAALERFATGPGAAMQNHVASPCHGCAAGQANGAPDGI
jgi:hypothetical protein